MIAMVRVKVMGYNLDQLINKLQSSHIVCYNIERVENNVMFFNVKFNQFGKVKPLLKNYEYKIKYLGLANLKKWSIKNLAILLVLPIAISLIFFSTKITWNIKIYGESHLQKQVISILKDNNIAVGKFLPKNNKNIEQILLKQFPNIAQVSCITRGTTIVINISEKLVYTPQNYEPIKAKFNGIVTNISLTSGTMAVGQGDFVSAGDILVYPFTLDKEGNQVSVEPIAEIRAKAYVVGSCKLSATSVKLVRTGKKHTTSSISFLSKNLFSKKCSKPFALYETSVYNEYISSVLPIKRIKTIYYELDYVTVNYDLVAEQGNVQQQSIDLAYQNLPSNSDILDEQTTSVIINDTLYSTTTLTISTIIS